MNFTEEEIKLLKYIFKGKIDSLKVAYRNLSENISEISEVKNLPKEELMDSAADLLPQFWETMEAMYKDPNTFETLKEEYANWVLQVLMNESDHQKLPTDDIEAKMMKYFFMRFSNQN